MEEKEQLPSSQAPLSRQEEHGVTTGTTVFNDELLFDSDLFTKEDDMIFNLMMTGNTNDHHLFSKGQALSSKELVSEELKRNRKDAPNLPIGANAKVALLQQRNGNHHTSEETSLTSKKKSKKKVDKSSTSDSNNNTDSKQQQQVQKRKKQKDCNKSNRKIIKDETSIGETAEMKPPPKKKRASMSTPPPPLPPEALTYLKQHIGPPNFFPYQPLPLHFTGQELQNPSFLRSLKLMATDPSLHIAQFQQEQEHHQQNDVLLLDLQRVVDLMKAKREYTEQQIALLDAYRTQVEPLWRTTPMVRDEEREEEEEEEGEQVIFNADGTVKGYERLVKLRLRCDSLAGEIFLEPKKKGRNFLKVKVLMPTPGSSSAAFESKAAFDRKAARVEQPLLESHHHHHHHHHHHQSSSSSSSWSSSLPCPTTYSSSDLSGSTSHNVVHMEEAEATQSAMQEEKDVHMMTGSSTILPTSAVEAEEVDHNNVTKRKKRRKKRKKGHFPTSYPPTTTSSPSITTDLPFYDPLDAYTEFDSTARHLWLYLDEASYLLPALHLLGVTSGGNTVTAERTLQEILPYELEVDDSSSSHQHHREEFEYDVPDLEYEAMLEAVLEQEEGLSSTVPTEVAFSTKHEEEEEVLQNPMFHRLLSALVHPPGSRDEGEEEEEEEPTSEEEEEEGMEKKMLLRRNRSEPLKTKTTKKQQLDSTTTSNEEVAIPPSLLLLLSSEGLSTNSHNNSSRGIPGRHNSPSLDVKLTSELHDLGILEALDVLRATRRHHVRGKKEAYEGHHTAQLEEELARSIRQEERWLSRLKRKNNARIGRLRLRIWQKLQDELQSHSKNVTDQEVLERYQKLLKRKQMREQRLELKKAKAAAAAATATITEDPHVPMMPSSSSSSSFTTTTSSSAASRHTTAHISLPDSFSSTSVTSSTAFTATTTTTSDDENEKEEGERRIKQTNHQAPSTTTAANLPPPPAPLQLQPPEPDEQLIMIIEPSPGLLSADNGDFLGLGLRLLDDDDDVNSDVLPP